jgi:hypothetical protein
LVLFNVTVLCINFQLIKTQQAKCYFEDHNFSRDDSKKGNDCIRDWLSLSYVKFLVWMSDVNVSMLMPFSENLGLIPYLLRSLRIQKMFSVRDKYCELD